MTRIRIIWAFISLTIIVSGLFTPPIGYCQNTDRVFPKLLMTYYNPDPSCELNAALDLLAVELSQDSNLYGYLIVYRGYNNPQSSSHKFNPPGLFYRHSFGVMNYLLTERSIPNEQIEIVYGGLRKEFQTEVWLTTKGGRLPEFNTTDHTENAKGKQQELFDEYIYNSENEMAVYFDSPAKLGGFANALSSDPDSIGYIIGYGQCLDIGERQLISRDGKADYVSRRYQECDPTNTAKRIAEAEKATLTDFYGISPSRVRVINGGYRNSQMIELWKVQKDGEIPELTPSVYRLKDK